MLHYRCAVLPVIMKDRAVFYREKSSGTYGPLAYALSVFLIDLPYIFLAIALFATPFYFLVGFQHDAELFFKFLFGAFLSALSFNSMGHFLSAVMPNMIVAGNVCALSVLAVFECGKLPW